MYKRIVDECYVISHEIHTSYLDLMNITPFERRCMLEHLNREATKRNEQAEEFERRMQERRQ